MINSSLSRTFSQFSNLCTYSAEWFSEKFERLQAEKEADEVHYFIDAVHPTLNSETSYGWIEKGTEHQVLSNSGRTRMNILGALNPNEIMDVITKEYKTIESEAAKDFLAELGKKNPKAEKIRIFTDNASYFKKLITDNLIEEQRIEIHWLPTYAPNLNLIERLLTCNFGVLKFSQSNSD